MSLPVTLAIMAVAGVGLALSSWQARRPTDPGRPRLVPMGAIQFLSILVIVLMAAHLVSLLTGHTLTSRYFG
jgi:hypothetical protein